MTWKPPSYTLTPKERTLINNFGEKPKREKRSWELPSLKPKKYYPRRKKIIITEQMNEEFNKEWEQAKKTWEWHNNNLAVNQSIGDTHDTN